MAHGASGRLSALLWINQHDREKILPLARVLGGLRQAEDNFSGSRQARCHSLYW